MTIVRLLETCIVNVAVSGLTLNVGDHASDPRSSQTKDDFISNILLINK
jgi:hypothetical protein